MSIVIEKPKDIKCPHCGNKWEFLGFDYDFPKDVFWKPNGHKFIMGNKQVEGFNPFPFKVTCKNCHKVFRIEYSNKERVEFT
jgi:hypothetical protein